MSTYSTERIFRADQKTVFSYVTQTEHLMKWWGPEGMSVKAHDLDLSRLGPWYSTLVNAEGGVHKMSGEVTSLQPPSCVEFTWAWHNDHDERGHETLVRMEVRAHERGGTKFILVHSGHESDDVADRHDIGWSSSLRKLERLADR